MIDLRQRDLPDTIVVGGKSFLLNTDFRVWLNFSEWLKKGDKARLCDLGFLFKDEMPYCYTEKEGLELYTELCTFYANPNVTPRDSGGNESVVLDYILDGEFIYASFMQVYGIDLTTVDMHWHKFKALFISLPDSCKIMQIMKYRAYHKSNQKQEDVYAEQKRLWALPTDNEYTKEELEKINEELNEEFYNT